ncbi:MAG: YdcF family protein, partial [Alphaproteobacteria bacterium]
MLAIRDPIRRADVIVVLGGDGPTRAARAADLWLEGVAPRILVSGDGDCYWIKRAMTDRGVDRDSIDVECQSGTTWENALFS